MYSLNQAYFPVTGRGSSEFREVLGAGAAWTAGSGVILAFTPTSTSAPCFGLQPARTSIAPVKTNRPKM